MLHSLFMTIAMISFFVLPWLMLLCIVLLFLSIAYLIMLILHLCLPKLNIKWIHAPEQDSLKTQRVKWTLLILFPVCWLSMIVLSICNAWYQAGVFYSLSFEADLFLLILIEYSLIFGVKKWRTLNRSGLISLAIAIVLSIGAFYYSGQIARGEQPLLAKIEDLRLKHDLPIYQKLIKETEINGTFDISKMPVPNDDINAKRDYTWSNDSGVLKIQILTGGFGVASNGVSWGYVYIANDNPKALNGYLRVRKIMPCWYRYVM